MPATESLTIEIQGDSSGLSQALDSALAKVESLRSTADNAATAAGGIGGRLANISSALQPLQLVSQQLTRISQQAQALNRQPISLNVQPALSALQSLMSAIQAVAARLSALSQMGGGGIRGPLGAGGGAGSARGGPGAASSSSLGAVLRTGAQLANAPTPGTVELMTAVSLAATQTPVLGDIPATGRNSGSAFPSEFGSTSRSYSSLDQSSSTVNHYGGITIEVRETADVNALIRDLRLQGLSTRHRQG